MLSSASCGNALALPVVLALAFAGGAPSQVPAAESEPSWRISTSVNLVVLPAAVRDHKGAFVSDLREQDFVIYEDRVLQSLRLFRHEDVPVTVGLVVDHSGSMRTKLTDVAAAVRTFLRFSRPEDEMFVVNFNDRVTMGLRLSTGLTDRFGLLAQAVLETRAEGETALYDAVIEAQEQLQSGRHEKKVLIVISDGGDNASEHSLENVLKTAGQSSSLVYTIGIFDKADPDRNRDVLQRLARTTGGEAFFPGQSSEVIAICERIANDIRHQYTLGYVSTSAQRPGAWRAVRVLAGGPGHRKLLVRTRSGYMSRVESGSPAGRESK